MKNKRFMKTLITSMLAVSLFVTPVFASSMTLKTERESNNTQSTACKRDLQMPYFDTVAVVGSLNDPIDKDDWYKLKLDSQPETTGYNLVRMDAEFFGTDKATYKVTMLTDKNGKIGEKIVYPGQNMYEPRIYLKNDQYMYVHVELIDGDPVRPYKLYFDKDKAFK
ncbi:hypothetical protein [Crassaminicella profunda]|uniref:hypothetical protein n=1 Tax=Crassaminicella profunda TaxID=1286698 RepID=UPI001CA6820C|nr:hypothetical protein [Crassaminicella profunda]QZY53788.1 hypothetical protein K7H06_12035 [Crassaminicella profunda]